ncbi:MAG: sodium/proton antiporter NhaB [Desulfovibrionaceae bacterium]
MATRTVSEALYKNFLGNAPEWYKLTILGFLIANPILLSLVGGAVTGWVLILEFIFTLAMALKCYPLPAGGLLALEAVFLGMTKPLTIYAEAKDNFAVILLLIFMVAGIYFMKDLLQYTFTKILTKIRSKIIISLLFCFAGAFLSAFLDALTVTAVIIAVAYGFYNVYHRYVSGKPTGDHDLSREDALKEMAQQDLKQFRGYLRNLMMHGAVGTALGGVCTLVGEPQNLLIGEKMGWHFMNFFYLVSPVSIPVLIVGLITCALLEKFHLFSYGFQLPGNVRSVLLEEATRRDDARGKRGRAQLLIQAGVGVWLVLALALHLAEVGLIGLSVIVILTSLCGTTDEHAIGHAFREALPFTALLVVFFTIVAVIHDQHLFAPIIHWVLSMSGKMQLVAYYAANGLLSSISDNVFVATVYITDTLNAARLNPDQLQALVAAIQAIPSDALGLVADAVAKATPETLNGLASVVTTLPADSLNHLAAALAPVDATELKDVAEVIRQAASGETMATLRDMNLLMPAEHLNQLAIAINTGTNIPSVATPNGQAAFLFLLTSALAPVIRLSYGRMVWLALPYTITMSLTGLVATWYMPETYTWLVDFLNIGHLVH